MLFLVLSKKSVDFMSRVYSRAKQTCGPCQVALSCCHASEEQDDPASSPVLYTNTGAATGKGKVTLNTDP